MSALIDDPVTEKEAAPQLAEVTNSPPVAVRVHVLRL
jgi:hypothetical protein